MLVCNSTPLRKSVLLGKITPAMFAGRFIVSIVVTKYQRFCSKVKTPSESGTNGVAFGVCRVSTKSDPLPSMVRMPDSRRSKPTPSGSRSSLSERFKIGIWPFFAVIALGGMITVVLSLRNVPAVAGQAQIITSQQTRFRSESRHRPSASMPWGTSRNRAIGGQAVLAAICPRSGPGSQRW